MADSAQVIDGHYDMAVAFLEGGSTYYIHDHIRADRKVTFLHVDYSYAGYRRSLDRDCYLDFDRVFTVSDEVKRVFWKFIRSVEVTLVCSIIFWITKKLSENQN